MSKTAIGSSAGRSIATSFCRGGLWYNWSWYINLTPCHFNRFLHNKIHLSLPKSFILKLRKNKNCNTSIFFLLDYKKTQIYNTTLGLSKPQLIDKTYGSCFSPRLCFVGWKRSQESHHAGVTCSGHKLCPKTCPNVCSIPAGLKALLPGFTSLCLTF